jgi:hypothetical protein
MLEKDKKVLVFQGFRRIFTTFSPKLHALTKAQVHAIQCIGTL